jgi:hypothetical protein
MIEHPGRNADYLNLPEVRSKLRARPVASYLGARRGVVGYGLLVAVTAAAAVEAWRNVSPWLGVALAVVTAHALFDLVVSWYRVASLPYLQAFKRPNETGTETESGERGGDPHSTPPPPTARTNPTPGTADASRPDRYPYAT